MGNFLEFKTNKIFEKARMRNFGYDIYFIEDEWRMWAAGKEAPRDPDRAFLALFRSFSEKTLRK